MSQRAIVRSTYSVLGSLVLGISTAATAGAQPASGTLDVEKPRVAADASGGDATAVDRPGDDRAEPREAIPLGSSRIGYAVRGGLLGVDNLLLIDDDGTVFYRASSVSVPRENFVIHARIAESHVRALKLLMREVGFESMPPSFEPDGIVMDGVDYGVAARLPGGGQKTVWSTTAAEEPAGFTRLRRTFDELILELREGQVLKLTTLSADASGRVREFRLLADGRFRIEIRVDGEPLSWGEGRLSASEREAIEIGLANFDFAGSSMCRAADVIGAEVHELLVTREGESVAVAFTADGEDEELDPLLDVLDAAKRAARDVGL